jgi:hypothetical protein
MLVTIIIAIVIAVLVAVSIIGSATGVASLTDMDRETPTLTCFHCGNATEVGRPHCQHCKKELQ